MAKEIVSNELWAVIEPLLPPPKPRPKGGRPPIPDRKVLTGIFVCPDDGHPLGDAPQGDGLWQRHDLLAKTPGLAASWGLEAPPPGAAGPVGGGGQDRRVSGFPRLGHGACPRGGEATGPNPWARGKSGTKRHLGVDQNGIPLAVTVSAANVPDMRMMEATLEVMEPIRRPRGRPRKRPDKLHADKAYDAAKVRQWLRRRGIRPRIARRGVESSEKLGRYRWVVERTHAWLNRYRRLKIRYERRVDIHLAFLYIGCALICWKFIQAWFC